MCVTGAYDSQVSLTSGDVFAGFTIVSAIGSGRMGAVPPEHRRSARLGEFDGQLWISMDYVDGSDVSDILTEPRR